MSGGGVAARVCGMAKFVKLIPLLVVVALLAGVPATVSGQSLGEPFARSTAQEIFFPYQNYRPTGIWSDGTTMWVADSFVDKLYAYNLSTKQRDATKDFDTLDAAGNDSPDGVWSDRTTMWVSDYNDLKIYAYDLETKQRDTAKDFDTLSGSGFNNTRSIWSDGTTMWLSDGGHDKIYAYNLAAKERDARKDFNTLRATGAGHPTGIWSDRTTMWVVDSAADKISAYNLATKDRDPSKDFDTLVAAGNTFFSRPYSTGIWSNGTTMWVADYDDDEIYAYDLATKQRDAAKDFDTLAAAGNIFPAGIWSDGTTMWVADAGNYKIYAYNLASKERDTGRDFDTLPAGGNDDPRGIWSDRRTMWVADEKDGKMFAYNLSTKGRDAAKDFNTLIAAGNSNPTGIWSDSTTMWVADSEDDKIYAHNLSTKQRDADKDFDTLSAANNNDPRGLWSDRTTMWVADSEDDKIYAYNLATKERDADKDFDTLPAAGNNDPQGLWSDGTTVWVADDVDDKLYAYNLATKERDTGKDFDTLSAAGNDSPMGIWSNGTTMWVAADLFENKIYAYNMPARDCSVVSDPDIDGVHFLQGILEGRQLGCTNPSVSVSPSQSITGNISILATNIHEPSVIFPVGATTSWGDHETSYWQIDDWAPAATSTSYSVPINLTAPSAPGTYSIWVAAGAQTTLAHVMSCTHWPNGPPVWNDGNDIADWASVQTRCDSTVTPDGVGLRIAVVVRSETRTTTRIDTVEDPDPPSPSVISVERCVNEVGDDDGGEIELGDTIKDSWVGGCPSITRGGRMAKYYTFDLPITTTTEIALDSHLDDYLVLRSGGLSGDIAEQDDDDGPGNNALIASTLKAGTYTIEATTFYADGVEAEFTLSVKAVPRILYDGPVSDVAHEDYTADGPTMTVKLLPTLPMGTLEITIEDADGFDEGTGPLGGAQADGGSAGTVLLALPRTAWVQYSGIAVEVKQSGTWTAHTTADEQSMLANGVTATGLGPLLLGLIQILGQAEGALPLLQSLSTLVGPATADGSIEPDESVLDSVFRKAHGNCVSQVTVPWLVQETETTGVRVSVPVMLEDDDYLSLAVSFVAGGNEPALAQLHDLLATGNAAPPCQAPESSSQ